LVERLVSVFSRETLSDLARSSKFVQRVSKFSADKFLDILIKDASGKRGMSLLDYSNELLSVHGISISAQGICERFNDYAVAFLRRLVLVLFNQQIRQPFDHDFLKRYQCVRLWDSTKIELPEHMAGDFPGFGGGASTSGISIQYRYDVKNGAASSLDVFPAVKSDAKYTEEIQVEKDSLEIFDLGYFSTDFLKRLDEGGSHYVCRLHTQAEVYDLGGSKLNLKKIYRWMRLYRIGIYSKDVLIGQKRIPARIVITLVDEQTYQKRLKKGKNEYGKNSWKPSEEYKVRLRMNLMITNTPQDEIPDEKVYMLYKFRWQIELIFKSWKSSGWNIENIKEVKYERYMCILYAKLLMIMLSDQIFAVIARERYRQDNELLSKGKCVKTLCEQIQLLRKLINTSIEMIGEVLEMISRMFTRGHILCHRKHRTNYAELIDLFICKTK